LNLLKFYKFLEPKWLDSPKKSEQPRKIWSYSSGFAQKKACSLLSSRIARRIENLERHVSGIHLVAANGLTVPTEGGAFINVSVGNISETFYTFIQPDTATDLLLGTNFLARFRTVTLSYVDSSVVLDGTKISAIGLPYNGPKSRGAIVLDENIVVPARSRLRFSAPAAAIFSDGSEVVLEPRKDAYQHYGIYVADTINRVYNRRIFLEVFNGTNDDKTLCAGSTIGTIRLYQSDTSPMAQVNRTQTATPQIDLKYLKQAADLSDTDLTDEEKAALIHVLADYPQLYATSRNAAGTTTLVKHRIDTGDAKPIKARPSRMAPKERDLINEEIDRLVTEGIVRPSQSEWSSNIVLVRKKDGSHRMCVDYRNHPGTQRPGQQHAMIPRQVTHAARRDQPQPPTDRRHNNTRVCFNCEERGHLAAKCPRPPRRQVNRVWATEGPTDRYETQTFKNTMGGNGQIFTISAFTAPTWTNEGLTAAKPTDQGVKEHEEPDHHHQKESPVEWRLRPLDQIEFP